MTKRVKMLFLGDSPLASTGFGRFNRYLLEGLYNTDLFDITVVANNYWESYYDQKEYPYRIWNAHNAGDNYGSKMFNEMLRREHFDLLFTHEDISQITRYERIITANREKNPLLKDTKWLAFAPIDNTLQLRFGVESFAKADIPVTYSQFGYNEITKFFPELKDKLQWVYLSVDPNEFYPIDKERQLEVRKQLFKSYKNIGRDTFIVGQINRNQARKDLPRSMLVFKLFKDSLPKDEKDVIYYLHSWKNDSGGDLDIQAKVMGLKDGDLYYLPDDLDPFKMLPQNQLNDIFHVFDASIATDTGEGFGYFHAESFLNEIPTLFPRNTTHIEFTGENEERGYLADSQSTTSEFMINFGQDNATRPITNVDSAVAKLRYIHDNYKQAKKKTQLARQFAIDNFNRETILNKWLKIFIKNGII